ncbi:Uncharacterised protein [Mycobacteroides abscessus subsp. abscessus]|uniref:helix-turn-helix domain-containing protein n=1 Tax=Mycobacteroides abscessus TaxID=36809 RepID=UPI00092B90A9|nr:helix-turn-helix domain-containing protein [Mycobacteroides abscessus]SIM00620.1 Uncharacterised protein [Mycobacteroides abscessus subsp. abscessus]SLD01593.1 Uncharacterised protein [Mycobacteroides abscessus subsp. abscessus]
MKFNKFRWNDHPARVKLRDTPAMLATEMFNRANMDGTEIYGSQENLAKLLGASVSSIRRAQKRLQELGLIERDGKRGSGRGGRSTKWRLTMPPNTGHSDSNTGHRCAEYRSPVQEIPVISDRLIDPGNRPGSFLSTRAGEDTESEPALGAVSAERQTSDLGSLYDTPTESDLPSVAHIAVPSGTALVHQPTTETDHPSGLSEEDRAAILADLYGSAAEPSRCASDPAPIRRAHTALPAPVSMVPVDEPGWDGSGTPWPRDKAIPADPWAAPYYDEQTGEHFEYRPGELPHVM